MQEQQACLLRAVHLCSALRLPCISRGAQQPTCSRDDEGVATSPAAGASCPAITRISEDLPLPLRPSWGCMGPKEKVDKVIDNQDYVGSGRGTGTWRKSNGPREDLGEAACTLPCCV